MKYLKFIAIAIIALTASCFSQQNNNWLPTSQRLDTGSPLSVYVPDDVRATLGNAVNDGVDYWNRQVGCEVFRTHSIDVGADVKVALNEPGKSYLSNSAIASFGGVPSYLRIWLSPMLNEWVAPVAAAHELGHALGLANDNIRNSIMNNKLLYIGKDGDEPGTATMTLDGAQVGEKTLQTLRAKYCH